MTRNAPSFGLKELLSPLSVEDFISKYWLPNKPVVIHGNLSRLSGFGNLSELSSIEEFAPKYYGRVSAIHQNGDSVDVQSGNEALPYLRKGYTVYFRHIQNHFPSLKPVLVQLARDLAMPSAQFTSEIFTSSRESGVPFHSDYDLNFSLLLSGRKKEWTYAENESISNQTGICMPAEIDQIEPAQMKFLTKKPLPKEMPANSVTEALLPGDLIFMPRGWWHTTHSFGDCVSVNFVMKGPHWAHLLSLALEKDLIADSRWRTYPYGVAAEDEKKELAIEEFAQLLAELKESFKRETNHETAARLIRKYFEE